MTKYQGKTLFLEEQEDGRYTLYNWYHAPIATEELEALVPMIRDWQPPKPIRSMYDMDLLNELFDLLGEGQ